MRHGRIRQGRLRLRTAGPRLLLLVLSLLLGLAGCASITSPRPAASPGLPALAAAYLAIARPANHRLDHAVDGFGDSSRDDLTAARADLRAEVAAEHWFDGRLLRIPFPVPVEAVARAMVAANVQRIALTEREARSASLAALGSFAARHRAADAQVEIFVRAIRRLLHLPPPVTS